MAPGCFSPVIRAWLPPCNLQEILCACELQLTWIRSTNGYWQCASVSVRSQPL